MTKNFGSKDRGFTLIMTERKGSSGEKIDD